MAITSRPPRQWPRVAWWGGVCALLSIAAWQALIVLHAGAHPVRELSSILPSSAAAVEVPAVGGLLFAMDSLFRRMEL